MKTQNLKIAFLFTGILIVNMVFSKPKIAVANIDYKGKDSNPTSLGNYLRIEMAKVDAFEVTDRYDQEYLLKKKDFTIENCYGKLCLVEVGKMLGVDKMISGSIDTYGETILLTLNLIDVATSTTEKTFVKEYLNLPQEFPGIISCAVKEMNSLPMDNEYLKRVTKKFNLESSVNNPEKTTLNMSGPRFGVAFLTGDAARVMRAGKQDGGFDGYPYLFQFGYQFEKQYLTQGNLQALFEFLPMINGLDQGLFIPSLTILHGLRSNKNGFEFAFGPTVRFTKEAEGYFDANNNWNIGSTWSGSPAANPYPLVTRMDSRGEVKLEGGFVFAVGFTIKSGNLNIPLNTFVMPSKDGVRFGASFGFNAKKN
jgi:hypothetical protein